MYGFIQSGVEQKRNTLERRFCTRNVNHAHNFENISEKMYLLLWGSKVANSQIQKVFFSFSSLKSLLFPFKTHKTIWKLQSTLPS